MRKICFFLAFIVTTACAQQAEIVVSDAGSHYGEMITVDNALTYDELLLQLGEKAEITDVKVKGMVEKVCQAKGCWMNIVSETNPSEEPMFVKFKDYGFFMPKDLAGQSVIMRGKAYKEETSVDELRHYAEDEGKSKEEIAAITEPAVELKFMADGVIIPNQE